METGPIIYQWHFDPFILALAMCIVYLYYKIDGFRQQKDIFCFWTAISLFVLLEFSPLHFLGMHYYFSAHMLTHVVVLLICGPLLVISIPNKSPSPTPKNLQILSSLLYKHAWLGWFAGVGIMWFWHFPVVFDASFTAMNNHFSIIPLLHAASMLIAGMLFSWPLFGPFKNYHIHPLSGIVYLFTACTSCSLLGLLIAFAPLNTFHYYTNLSNSMNMGGLNPWGLSVKSDQQAAGLIMWVPCCFVYLTACIYLLQRWFRESGIQKNNQLVKLNTSLIEHD